MSSNALTVREAGSLARQIFGDDYDAIKNGIAVGLTDGELDYLAAVERRTGLSLLDKQFYGIKRSVYNRDTNQYEMALTIQTGIDGYRLLAKRTGEYRGQLGPYWCGPDGEWKDVWLASEPPAAAKVGVLHTDFTEPLWAVAVWVSYVQLTKSGKPVNLWEKMPDVMLAKCFDEETDVLTTEGFERFGSVWGDVLMVTPTGLEATDSHPFVQEYNGPMVTLDSDDLNFCVTPNHDMLTTAGKIEAGEMFEQARARPVHRIPRLVTGSRPDLPISDQSIELAAIYMADGSDSSGVSFRVGVSRQYKIDRIEQIGGWDSRGIVHSGGNTAQVGTRTITTHADKDVFQFSRSLVSALCNANKAVRMEQIARLSQRQARLFVDTLITFDGHEHRGVKRFYTSREDHAAAFELAAVIAGYSVSGRKTRHSDISTKPNIYITVSERDDIAVVRWGREYQNLNPITSSRQHTGLEMRPNATRRVWCVTVPSGVIVVRRHGFSMLCGNCAESLAIRKAFPRETSGIYTTEEMGQADNPPATARVTPAEQPVRAQIAPAPTPVDPSNVHQHAHLRAIAEQGFPLGARISDLGHERIEDLDREQARALILEGRTHVRGTQNGSQPAGPPPPSALPATWLSGKQIELFWATAHENGFSDDEIRQAMRDIYPDRLDPARGEVSLKSLTRGEFDEMLDYFRGYKTKIALSGGGYALRDVTSPPPESDGSEQPALN